MTHERRERILEKLAASKDTGSRAKATALGALGGLGPLLAPVGAEKGKGLRTFAGSLAGNTAGFYAGKALGKGLGGARGAAIGSIIGGLGGGAGGAYLAHGKDKRRLKRKRK